MCGCQERRDALNEWRPGLGDRVATVAEPVKQAAFQVVAWLRGKRP